MIRRVLAIAALTVRTAVRSRLVAALLALLGLIAIGLPLLVTGDGTPDGELRLSLSYALGGAVGVLGLATLWTTCGAVALEIANRRLQLTWTRPVRGLELWFGKWIGIVLLDALLLVVVASVTRVALAWRATDTSSGAPIQLLSRSRHPPQLPSLRAEAEALLARNPPPPGLSRHAALQQLQQRLPERYVALAPGGELRWTFRLDRPLAPDTPLWIKLRFETDETTRMRVRGACRLTNPQGASVAFEIDDFTVNELELPVPAAALAGSRDLTLHFRHVGEADTGSLLIQPRRGLALLEPCGTFTGNLARGLLVQLALLALLAALGLTLGTLFSFPVAAFCATGLLLATLVSTFAMHDALLEPDEPPGAGHEAGATLRTRVSRAVVTGLTAAAQPILAPRPLAHLAAGERVPGSEIAHAVWWNLVCGPLVLACVGAGVLSRRELAR